MLGFDFIRLHNAFNSTVELRWTAAEQTILQWLTGLVWERNSLADSQGSLRPWKLLFLIGGPYFVDSQLRSGSSFHRNIMTAPMTCLCCTADAHERQRRRRRDRHRAAALGRAQIEPGGASGAGLRACDRRSKRCIGADTCTAHGNAHVRKDRSALTGPG